MGTTTAGASLDRTLRQPESVCLVLLTGLGDVIHGLPLANAIRRAWPDTRLTWVVEPMPAGVLVPHPAIDRVVVYHKKDGWRGVRALRLELARDRFDLTLNLNIYFKGIWPTVFSRANVRLGFDRARSRDGTWLVANRRLPARPRAHTQDMMLEFLEVLGIPAEPLEWRLQLTEEERAAQQALLEEVGGRYVALVPASANPKKDWLPERMARVADALAAEFGRRTVLIGGPGAREQELADRIRRLADRPPFRALGDGVRRLLWQIEAAELVIAPDTGPVHIARALERPVIGLYGHTNPWRVGPYRKYQDLWVDAYTDGAPDPSNIHPKLGRMERITVDDVLERMERALAGH